MENRCDLTDIDTDTSHQYLKITPTYYYNVNVAPPTNLSNLIPTSTDEIIQYREINLVKSGRITTISEGLHERLLEQSIEEYGDIWRSLAEK